MTSMKPMLEGEKRYKYDVFLSFRGNDTRNGFISHLDDALSGAGILTFLEDRLQRGEELWKSLSEAIELSRISLVLISRNYADSGWCLEELVKIMDCHEKGDNVVIPVFYHVEPSDVRKQKGAFGKAFQNLKRRISPAPEVEQGYRNTLTRVANLSGWHSVNHKTESQLIKEIVNDASRKLENQSLSMPDYSVGIEPLVQKVMSELQGHAKSDAVLIIGLWGLGGIGKTTLAKGIFNALRWGFNRRSFIKDIREAWEHHNAKNLQGKLISDIRGERQLQIYSTDMEEEIKTRLRHTRALILLDDMNDEDQRKALCGNRNWFAPSSLIIITTRNKAILDNLEADYVFEMDELDNIQSLELFRWHAFRSSSPTNDFVELSSNIVAYCGGLPLALEVLGSFLFNKRSILVWKDLFLKLQKIPHDKVHEKLKISYDGLDDQMQKDIFLDICCFFINKNKNYATTILNGCGMHAEIGMTVLIERSLVKVNERNNKLEMHDLLRDMGREIIREKSPEMLEERSRLWFHEDALDVLSKHSGTKHVKGLALKSQRNNRIFLPIKAFKQMKSLRLLQLSHVQLTGKYDGLLENLRWICWLEFAERYPPQNFFRGSLVAIDFRHSNLNLFCNVPQVLPKLKILNLSHSHYLRMTPDFSYMPNLERLILKDCPSLSKVHETIRKLNEIRLVNFKGCKRLRDLPRSFYKLKSLKIFILSDSKIEKLEDDIEQLESLETLDAKNTAITIAPFSILRLKNIKKISLCGYEGLPCDVFPSLFRSWMSPLNNPRSLAKVSVSTSSSMCLSRENNLNATNYLLPKTSQSTSLVLNKGDSVIVVSHNQVGISRSENSMSSLLIEVGEQSILQGWLADQSGNSSFPFENHPNWPSYNNQGQGVCFEVPHVGCNLKGIILCIDYSGSQDNMTSPFPFSILVQNNTKNTIQLYKQDSKTIIDDGSQWPGIVSNLVPGDEVEITVNFGQRFIVNKTTIYLIYDQSNDKEVEASSTRNKDAVSIDKSSAYEKPKMFNPKRADPDDDEQEEEQRAPFKIARRQ